jgi:3-hydroxy acid dehydrogenase / malonic semialdehyde reductase
MRKNILVTGATSGFGKAIAELFASKGYDVIITGRRQERLQQIKEDWTNKYGITVSTLLFDVRDKDAVQQSIAELLKEIVHIDILVNNAGLASGMSSIEEGDTDDWDTMIDTNVKGAIVCYQTNSTGYETTGLWTHF